MYDEHLKLAIYVTPSRCDDEICNSARVRLPSVETLPCRQPLDMPKGFVDSNVPKNQILNFSIFALEDVLVKVRIMFMLNLPIITFDVWKYITMLLMRNTNKSNCSIF